MKMNELKWDEKSYEKYLDYLVSLEDKKYREFHRSIVGHTNLKLIGIRVPKLRSIAKGISNGNVDEFLRRMGNTYYEEVMIYGFVLANSEEEYIDRYLMDYIKKVDNWAICDSFVSSLKIINKKMGKYWMYFTSLIDLNSEFQTRTSIVVFMNYYLCDNYIDRVLYIVSNIKSAYYYINMAISWLLSVAIINYQDKVIDILKSKKLSKFVQNKTINKIQDSYRVSKEIKDLVKLYRIK